MAGFLFILMGVARFADIIKYMTPQILKEKN